MDISIKGVPEDQVRRLRERAKANHRSLQGELRALIDEAAAATPRRLTVDEIVSRVSRLGLVRRDEAARLIREDRKIVRGSDAHSAVYDILAAANILLAPRRENCISARSAGRLARRIRVATDLDDIPVRPFC